LTLPSDPEGARSTAATGGAPYSERVQGRVEITVVVLVQRDVVIVFQLVTSGSLVEASTVTVTVTVDVVPRESWVVGPSMRSLASWPPWTGSGMFRKGLAAAAAANAKREADFNTISRTLMEFGRVNNGVSPLSNGVSAFYTLAYNR
jgi:hypothetical protein